VSTAKGYLEPARGRPNLRIVTNALVSKIEFANRVATGVVYHRGDTNHRAKVRGEVVLSAGSFGSPQILQLSGVGSARQLSDHGISVVEELKGVGENLIDHFLPKRIYRTSNPNSINAIMASPISRAMAGLRYMLTRTGPLASAAGLAGGYAFTGPHGEADPPDIQFFLMPFAGEGLSGELSKISSFQIAFYQNRPESRGWVRLRTGDYRDAPQIVANYLSSPGDVRATVEGMRFIGKIGTADPLKRWDALELRSDVPADPEGDEALLEYAKETGSTAFHHVGTCRMGEDDMAVVDPQLHVRGVSNLRVADGSVMPMILSGNTNAACIMIGEKCADMMRKDARR
jgi:choline dehydrogenase